MLKTETNKSNKIFYPSSAQGIISLLEEENDNIKVIALKKIELIIDSYWPEISDSLIVLESLSEDENFSERNLAAYLASKVFFLIIF